MKKISKKLLLRTETIRVLDDHSLSQAAGGSVSVGTSIRESTSIISVQTATTVQSSGTSVISRH